MSNESLESRVKWLEDRMSELLHERNAEQIGREVREMFARAVADVKAESAKLDAKQSVEIDHVIEHAIVNALARIDAGCAAINAMIGKKNTLCERGDAR